MRLESFSHPECASILNESFVPIIVDREERPDLDAIYMNYVQAVSNSGGWPLNLFLTPNMEPVLGGTYWPGPGGRRRAADDGTDEIPDFHSIVKRVRDIWSDQEARCRKEATDVVEQLREFAAEGTLGTKEISVASALTPSGWGVTEPNSDTAGAEPGVAVSSELDLDQLEEAYTHIAGTFDPVHGGFGIAPKFLTPPKLAFLLQLLDSPKAVQDVVGLAECEHATEMALDTLRKIRDGALHDHIGGTGFSRCSVTADWSIPNFEKLVVDNALLLSLYVDAWKRSGGNDQSEFFDVVIELAEYLTSPPIALADGGYASSEAADSHSKRGDKDMREGAYYTWTRREFESVLEQVDKNISPIVAAYFGVHEDGNVPEDHDPNDDFINQNILRIDRTPEQLSVQFSIPVEQIIEIIRQAKAALKEFRDQERIRPDIDEKIVTGWNSLVISALSRTAMALQNVHPELSKRCLLSSEKTAQLLINNFWHTRPNLLLRLNNSSPNISCSTDNYNTPMPTFADDYSNFVQSLLDLFQATSTQKYLDLALTVQRKLICL